MLHLLTDVSSTQTPAISINHNWANACNAMFVAQHLTKELFAVERELRSFGLVCDGDERHREGSLPQQMKMSCEEWREQCARLLLVNADMNMEMYLLMVMDALERNASLCTQLRMDDLDEAPQWMCLYRAVVAESILRAAMQDISEHIEPECVVAMERKLQRWSARLKAVVETRL